MIELLICLIVAILVASAVLGLVSALLQLPSLGHVQAYGNVLYALIVVILVLILIGYCFPGHLHRF